MVVVFRFFFTTVAFGSKFPQLWFKDTKELEVGVEEDRKDIEKETDIIDDEEKPKEKEIAEENPWEYRFVFLLDLDHMAGECTPGRRGAWLPLLSLHLVSRAKTPF